MLDPRLVVLDEPSMGLDPKTLRTVLRQVRTMWETGRTVLLVEQNVRAGLSLATRAVVVESGQVRLQGTGAEVLATRRSRTCISAAAPCPAPWSNADRNRSAPASRCLRR